MHMQSSDERTLVGIVTISDRPAGSASDGSTPDASAPTQLFIRNSTGETVAQYDLSVEPKVATAEPSASSTATLAAPPESATSGIAEPVAVDFDMTLTPVPGQKFTGPTEQDSAVFNLRSPSLAQPIFDWGNFEIEIADFSIILPIFNEVLLVPFFDGGLDKLGSSPVLAQVGKLFRLRGVGLLFALKVQITIHIRIVLLIGFRWDIWGGGYYNEFGSQYPWAIGSVVIGIRIEIEILIRISGLIALALPGGELRVLYSFNLTIDIDFTISSDGRTLRFDPDFEYRVNHTRIGPVRNLLFPCDGRFQLVEENGKYTFTDDIGGKQSFYFVRAAGECCVPWEFDLTLCGLRRTSRRKHYKTASAPATV